MTRKITAAAAVLALLATGCSASTDSSAPGGTLITGGTSTATSTPTPTPSSTTPAPATTTAGRTPTVTEVTASPSATESTTAASTTAAPTPTVSLDPSPLAGTGGGPQQPSSVPTLNSITDEDRGRALEAAKAIVAAYTSGKPYKEWSEELYPMVDPEVQNEYGPKSRIDLLKGTVISAELVDDPTLKVPGGDNPYWLTVSVRVEGSLSPAYYVRLHRTAERPNKWKASHILEPQGYKLFVEKRLKEQNK
ncbi:carbonic anhydrase [Rothia sp. HMSC066H02]|uniref:carbonic anhydrase n=1 Tax=unclassified Rothia (in: high G+C Gram-positive bacteria) TaxID=2689056 RepID=UPI0008A2F9BF|nr:MULTISPECIES: carbonic anhydrase [unclassified Rothia (in: high G+C Gram-positive bacteria)]OFO95718.1 carbonic anhydrase [Rothia sp. HMSC065D09]OFP14778.1 carbonic anhydrase [Rothia sp. HMSC066H02]